MKAFFMTLIFFVVPCGSVFAASEKTLYPELQVVPMASERLKIEVINEKKSFLKGYDIYLASTAGTLLAGVMGMIDPGKDNSDNETVNYITLGAGAALSGIGAYLAFHQTPYEDAYQPIKKMKTESTYEKLVRERMAEERLENIARFNRRLRVFTGIVQIGLGVALLSTSDDKDDRGIEFDESSRTNPTTLYAAGLSAAAGIINFVLPHPSETVSKLQKDYKKKIYSYVVPSAGGDGALLIAGIRF